MKLCDHDSRILVTSGDFYYPRVVRISLIMPSQARELIVLETLLNLVSLLMSAGSHGRV
jgi:hypothetical protein